jgi:hypothetical protein
MSSLPLAWYRISLSREQFDSGESEIVRAAFRGAYIACNGPRGAALYGGWGEDRAIYRMYFTPSALRCARALLKAYSGEACEPPDTRRLDWLYGDTDPKSGFGLAF